LENQNLSSGVLEKDQVLGRHLSGEGKKVKVRGGKEASRAIRNNGWGKGGPMHVFVV